MKTSIMSQAKKEGRSLFLKRPHYFLAGKRKKPVAPRRKGHARDATAKCVRSQAKSFASKEKDLVEI